MGLRPLFSEDGAHDALKPAFDRSETERVATWLQRCEQDLAQLWHHKGLWAITEVVGTKKGRTLKIVAMSGKWNEELLPAIESWGSDVGCIRAIYTGRKGWLRKCPEYKQVAVTAAKEL